MEYAGWGEWQGGLDGGSSLHWLATLLQRRTSCVRNSGGWQTTSIRRYLILARHTHHSNAALDSLRDDELFARFAEGEDDAYAALYGRYSARLLSYVHSIVGADEEAAGDIFQESFIRLFRERERRQNEEPAPEPIRNVGGWLFRVARNLALNHIRSQRYLAPLPALYDEHLLVTVEEAHSGIFGDADNEDLLMQAVNSVVQTLPAALREVFILREVNGMSYEETADIVGCSEEAARMRLSRARSAIRRALQPLFVEGHNK